jgi:hypothetical protein
LSDLVAQIVDHNNKEKEKDIINHRRSMSRDKEKQK